MQMKRTLELSALILGLAITAQPSIAQAPSNEESHRAAVKELMTVTHVRELMDQSSETMLAAQVQQMPQLAPYAGILRDFYKEQMNWSVLEPEFTQLYLEVFTEAELKELIAFYKSPIGQKMLEKMPVLMQKSNELSGKRIQAAMPQLMLKLQKAMQAKQDSERAKKPE